MSPRRVLIDTDTASDDAVALIMAFRSKAVQVEAVTVVAGNVPVAQATQNALFTAELCDSDVPVFAGADRPLQRTLETAHWFHGHDGLGDHGYRPRKRVPGGEHAVDALLRIIGATPGIELVTLGPLTNLALALMRNPALPEQVSRCVVMGGAPCCEGNVTPAAEFNIWVDPEAAAVVFRSGLPIELVGWQLSRGAAVLNASEMERTLAMGTATAEFAIRCNSTAAEAYRRQTGEAGLSLPDPVAMGILLDPSLAVGTSEHFVQIETQSELTRGMTVVDRLNVWDDDRNRALWAPSAAAGARRLRICWELDVPRWKQALFHSLSAETRASM